VTGWIADRFGLQLALASTTIPLLAALALCWVIPVGIFRRPAVARAATS